jgi:small-conductance mechanosensitive channel
MLRFALFVIAACVLASAGVAAPSLPLPKPAGETAPADTSGGLKTTPEADARREIRAEQEAAQKRLDAIEASPDRALGAPPDTPRREIAERLGLARSLTGIYQQQLDVLDRMEAARREHAAADKALTDWQGFPTPPPYSVLTVDALRDDVDTADVRIANANGRRSLFDRFAEEVGARSKASQAAARLAAEAAEGAAGTPAAPTLEWKRDLAAVRARVDDATRELIDIANRNAREEGEAAGASRDLAVRKLAAAGNSVTLSPHELAGIRADIDSRRAALDRAIEQSMRVSATALELRTAAEARLEQARNAPPAPGEDAAARDARIAALARDVEQKREISTRTSLGIELMKQNELLLDAERSLWEARAAAIATHDPVEARAIYEKVAASFATLRTWQEYVRQQLAVATTRAQEQEARVRLLSGDDAAHGQMLLDTYRLRENDLRRALDQMMPLERLLRHFRDDFEGRREASLGERIRDRAAATWLWIRRIWNYEVASVDDSYETADGRKLSVSRSVTLGKTVGAVLIVIVGYLLSSYIVRRIERFVVARRGVEPKAAALVRSWVLFLLTAILVVFALLNASIPLTAFAFLGGALAIAAGFGLQTLLKNFVAGLMLLLERPMRLGDLVDVDGVRGRVTAIGIRASTILNADGIETMIPNSAFVEGKLTNWTYSSPEGRSTIRVGVAYGSPLRKVGEVLEDVVARHGLVRKQPAPQVYLDEYGDSAISFAVAYWVDMTPDNDPRRIRSDLLHMIDRAFTEAGISIPFPQRDIRVASTAPLRVEVVPPAASDAPPKPAPNLKASAD